MTNFHVDLSHHDWDRTGGKFDFGKIKGATSGAVAIRATYGDPSGFNPDTRHFADMSKMARDAGFTLLGAYHNLIKGDQASINRQVDYLRREMDKVGSNWAMADVERYDELMDNGLYPRWDDVQQFHDRWYQVEQRVMAWYIPDWVWDASLGRHSLTGLRGPLVASEYGSNPSGLNPKDLYAKQGGDSSNKWHAYGGRTPEILQYGSRCNCPGASSATDANAYRGTFDQLSQLLGVNVALSTDDINKVAAEVEKRIFGHLVKGTSTPGYDKDRKFEQVAADQYQRTLDTLEAVEAMQVGGQTPEQIAQAIAKGIPPALVEAVRLALLENNPPDDEPGPPVDDLPQT